MWNTIRQNFFSISLSLLLHAVFIGLLLFSFSHTPKPRMLKPATSAKKEIIKAVVVDEALVQAELDKLKKEERRKRANEKARLKKLEDKARKAKQARKKEQKKLEEVKRKQVLAKKRLKEEQKKHLAQEKLEKKRLAEIKKKQAALEKKQADLKKKQRAEEKRLAELDAKRKQKEKEQQQREKKLRETALREQMEAERQQELMGIRERYMAAIGDKVRRNWRRPPNIEKGATCTVLVNQIPGGIVNSVRVMGCTGGNEILRRSVRMAVLKADPLPRASDPGVFDRDIQFEFIVEE
ncbi:MAG: cell envelope integrity protein TolA [Gammaproteobacteria bacterium]|nr:cell envelope integrity protein TolA [Gammaproteobacteria bacterium]